MAVEYTLTWANGSGSAPTGNFTLTDELGHENAVYYDTSSIGNLTDAVKRAIATELSSEAGAATGTITLTIDT